MSRAQAEQSSESTDRHTDLRQIHERLVDFIAAQKSLSKATLRLADSIVDFYAPEDDGFAPAVAFQTMAADGTSGLLCAQLQALVQTALRPLARHTAELSEIDALAKACKRKGESEHHYATKVNELNLKLETERREDKRALLQEKAARNINKLTVARRDRKGASEKLYQLIESSQQSSDACLNPIFGSICQFQEASYSHGHLLSSMLLRVVRSSLGISSLPMATAELDARELSQSPTRVSSGRPTTAASPVPESDAEGVLVWRDDGGGGGGGGVGVRGHDGGDDDDREDADVEVHDDDVDTQHEGVGVAGSCGASTALDGPENTDLDVDAAAGMVSGRPLEGSAAESVAVEVSNSIPRPSTPPTWAMGGVSSGGGGSGGAGLSDAAPPPYEVHMAAAGASSGGGAAASAGASDLAPTPYSMHVSGGLTGGGSGGGGGAAGTTMGCPRSEFLEAYLPWGKRRRMSGNLRWKNSGSGRSARQVFCAAEGRALVTYDAESDANAGLSPRSRHFVLGARSLWTGRNTPELEVTVADESELMTLGWNQHSTVSGGAATVPGLPFVETRCATLTAPGRHEHARWALALEETKSWREDLERDALLEELELSLPFRESALEYVRHNMPDDDRIEDILGVTAARHHPESILKSSVFDAAAAAFSEAPSVASGCFSSPEQTLNVCAAPNAVVGSSRPNLIRSGNMRRTIGSGGGPSASFRRRGLLSIFDSAKSPRGGGHSNNNRDDASGGFASAGGSNGGGGASRRWVGRRSAGKKKRDGGGSKGGAKRRNRSVSSGGDLRGGRDTSPLKTLGKSWHGGSARGRGSSRNGGGGTGGGGGRSVEFWSPPRRHSAADSTAEGLGSVSVGLGTECLGDFVGGGHALCRSRSSPYRRLAVATGPASEMFHLEFEPCSINHHRRTRFSSRGRSLILELVQEASGLVRHHHHSAAVGGGGGGLGANSSAAASATGTETGAESSAPSTPTVRLASGIRRASSSRRMDSNRRASSHRRDSHRRDSSRRASSHRRDSHRRDSSFRRFGSGSTLAGGCGEFRCGAWSTSGERSILGVPAPAFSEAAAPASGSAGFWYLQGGGDSAAVESDAGTCKLGAGGLGNNEPLVSQTLNVNILPRHSGINPYLARRPTNSTASTCLDSSDSFRAGAGGTAAGAADSNNDGGGANASGPDDERPPASRKVWEVWATKDEMPALPRNKQFVAAAASVSADAAGEPEKAEDGDDKMDVKDDDGDKGVDEGEGVEWERRLVAVGASSTPVGGIDGSEETAVDAAGFLAESGGMGEDSSGHRNALEHGRPSSGLFRSRFRRVSIDPDRTNSLTITAGDDDGREERPGSQGEGEVRARGDVSVRSLALLYSTGAAR